MHLLSLQGFWPQLLAGTWLTIQLALCALVIGFCLGLLGASAKLSNNSGLKVFANGITAVIRGVPELIVIFIVYFGSSQLIELIFNTQVEVSAFVAGVIALALIFGAYATETLRGAYLAIPKGQFEACQAFGFSRLTGFRRIILPQLIKFALPGIGNLWFVLLKDTALVSLIGAADLMQAAQNGAAFTKDYFDFYLVAALIYLVLTSVSLLGLRALRKKTSFATSRSQA